MSTSVDVGCEHPPCRQDGEYLTPIMTRGIFVIV